jgi:hypothetical protein
MIQEKTETWLKLEYTQKKNEQGLQVLSDPGDPMLQGSSFSHRLPLVPTRHFSARLLF